MAVSEASQAAEALGIEIGWVKKGLNGDKAALASIVRCHQDRVFRLLYRLSGNRELALDLTQETFLKAFLALGSFRGGSLGSWLFRIANNLFLDSLRARKADSLDAWLEDQPRELGKEDPAIRSFASESDLLSALALLPVPWRQAVVLRHIEDQPYEEMALILDVPLGTVKTWLYRGRDRLRTLLEGGEG